MQWVEESVRSTLGVAKEQKLEHDKSLTDLGLDSLLAVQLRNHLGKTIQLTLPVSLAFNYPTIADMIRFITDLLENALPKPNVESTSHSKPNESPNSASQSAQDLLADLEKLLN
jgi:acyl carrier protein